MNITELKARFAALRELTKLRKWPSVVQVLQTQEGLSFRVLRFDLQGKCWSNTVEFGPVTFAILFESDMLVQVEEPNRPEGVAGLLFKAIPKPPMVSAT